MKISTKRAFGAAALLAAVVCASAASVFLAGASARAQTKHGEGTLVLSSSAVVGLAPGQTLRVSVPSPYETAQSGESKPLQVKVSLLNNRGEVLYETAEAEIPVGGFHSFDIGREDIPLAGDPRTSATTVNVVVDSFPSKRITDAANHSHGQTYVNAGTLQLIDNDSGKTAMAMILPAVQKVREAAAR